MKHKNDHKPFIYQETQGDRAAFMRRGDSWATSDDYLTFAVADSPLRRLTIAKRAYPFDDVGGNFADLFCNRFVEYSKNLSFMGFWRIVTSMYLEVSTLKTK